MPYALYSRTSTSHQSKGLEAQVLALQTYCSQNGITDYVLYQDEAVSGSKQSRPKLNEMMSKINEGYFDGVIVYSFSRMARNIKHLLEILEQFQAHDVAFISVTEKIDTNTPLGRTIFVIIASLAQLERELIAERVCNGLINAKAKGKKLGRPSTTNHALIRELRASGSSYRAISMLTGHSIASISRSVSKFNQDSFRIK
jgi:DNA invertase Pin-like site-specific DNA recombinase